MNTIIVDNEVSDHIMYGCSMQLYCPAAYDASWSGEKLVMTKYVAMETGMEGAVM